MPYGTGLVAAFLLTRAARAAGWDDDALRVSAGARLAAIVDRAPTDALPAPGAYGTGALGPRHPVLERVATHAASAFALCWSGADVAQPLALAALACQHGGATPPVEARLLELCGALLDAAQARADETGDPLRAADLALLAHVVAATPEAGVPAALAGALGV